MVGVEEVSRGRACECVCPQCGCELVAKKGEVLAHHFSHLVGAKFNLAPCLHALETSVHLMAKQVIAERGGLRIPALVVSDTGFTLAGGEKSVRKELLGEQWLAFDAVRLEHRIDPLRVDIVGYCKGQPFIIEVTVANPLTAVKREQLRALGIPALEIDLRGISYDVSSAALEADVVEVVRKKRWLWHPGLEALQYQVRQEVQRAIEQENRVIEQRERADRERKAEALRKSRQARRNQQMLQVSVLQHSPPANALWLLCTTCRHIWQAALLERQEDRFSTVLCPACGAAVSRRSVR
jgi:ssDNA-binding Zn-finger/Zn-ribbon topoisomerase 1